MELSFENSVTEPGSDVTLKVKTEDSSLVSVCVIDSSIELMKKPLELTEGLVSGFMGESKLPNKSPESDAKDDMKTLNVKYF
jgi:hypothetical protein